MNIRKYWLLFIILFVSISGYGQDVSVTTYHKYTATSEDKWEEEKISTIELFRLPTRRMVIYEGENKSVYPVKTAEKYEKENKTMYELGVIIDNKLTTVRYHIYKDAETIVEILKNKLSENRYEKAIFYTTFEWKNFNSLY